MKKQLSTSSVGTQPIPGYTLRKRLGAGGYGEVWLADAPGGLTKAIKLVYGNVDESRASSELRSLERIRRANHPFLLSIERIEVVQGKVIIVTELAEGSLQDRFESCRRQNLPGIPRTELLDFLRDTADALDYLAQKHSLQHLDVKPGNLLIVADRIKVADFGLVKDLHDTNQSLVGGLTPTYSAPEVFDGRPNFRSDQYSLAIVYTEMLTGRLPFKGASAGELARQHLSQLPDLEPLPPADRNIVRRALSKNPLDRYATCRQFVDQLIKVRSTVIPVVENSERASNLTTDQVDRQKSTADTNNCNLGQQHVFHNAIAVEQLASQWVHARSMFIGVGGQGVLALRELRRDMIYNVDDRFNCDDHEWLAVDTSHEDLETATSGTGLEKLEWDCAAELPIYSPQSYRKFDPELFAPLSRRWLYNIPKSQRTEGVRPIAVLSLIAHYPALREMIQKKLGRLVKNHLADPDNNTPVNIYILSSLHGGTGGALIAEIGMMVRNAMNHLSFDNYRISATVSVATTSSGQAGASLPSANAITALSELVHWMDPSKERPQLDYRSGYVTSCVVPFDWVTLVDGGLLEDRTAKAQNPKNLARLVALDCQSLTAAALSESRSDARHASQLGWLRTACTTSIMDTPELTPEILAQWCHLQAIDSTRLYLSGLRPNTSELGEVETDAASTSFSQLPLTEEACDEFTRRLLKELGFAGPTDDVFNNGESIAIWARRISQDPEVRKRQLAIDLALWQSALRKIVQKRTYTWPHVCRVQSKVVNDIRVFSERQVPVLVKLFEKYTELLGKPANMQRSLRSYLSDLVLACTRLFELAEAETQLTIRRMDEWCRAMRQDPLVSELRKIDRTALPLQIQRLCARVISQLDGKYIGKLLAILTPTDPNPLALAAMPENPTALDAEHLRPTEMLEYSLNMVHYQCKELSIALEDLRAEVYHHTVIPLKDANKCHPSLATGGGEMIRMIICKDEQSSRIGQELDVLGIRSKTTILPGTQSLGVHLVCDAVNLNLAHIVTSLWRPTGATFNLAERVRTRVDIEWEPVSCLLDSTKSPANSALRDQRDVAGMEPSKGPAPLVDGAFRSAFPSELPLG